MSEEIRRDRTQIPAEQIDIFAACINWNIVWHCKPRKMETFIREIKQIVNRWGQLSVTWVPLNFSDSHIFECDPSRVSYWVGDKRRSRQKSTTLLKWHVRCVWHYFAFHQSEIPFPPSHSSQLHGTFFFSCHEDLTPSSVINFIGIKTRNTGCCRTNSKAIKILWYTKKATSFYPTSNE